MFNRPPAYSYSSSSASYHKPRQSQSNSYISQQAQRQNIQRQYMLLKQKIEDRIYQLEGRCLNAQRESVLDPSKIRASYAYQSNMDTSNNINNINYLQPQLRQYDHFHGQIQGNDACKYCKIEEQYAILKAEQKQDSIFQNRNQNFSTTQSINGPYSNRIHSYTYQYRQRQIPSANSEQNDENIRQSASNKHLQGSYQAKGYANQRYKINNMNSINNMSVNRSNNVVEKECVRQQQLNNFNKPYFMPTNNNSNISNSYNNSSNNLTSLPIQSQSTGSQQESVSIHKNSVPINKYPNGNINIINDIEILPEKKKGEKLKTLEDKISYLNTVRRSQSTQLMGERARVQSINKRNSRINGQVTGQKRYQEHNYHNHNHHRFQCKECSAMRNRMNGQQNMEPKYIKHSQSQESGRQIRNKRQSTEYAMYEGYQYTNGHTRPTSRAQEYQHYIKHNIKNKNYGRQQDQNQQQMAYRTNRINNRVQDERIGQKFKTNTEHFYPDHLKNSQRYSESVRAKSVSAYSAELKEGNRQLGMIRIVKDRVDSSKRSDHSRHSSKHCHSNKKVDSQYFIRKRSPYAYNHHHHNGHYDNYYIRKDISNNKYLRIDPNIINRYCPLHKTNQVIQKNESRSRRKIEQPNKNTEQRYQKQHESKVYKNFYTNYGVK